MSPEQASAPEAGKAGSGPVVRHDNPLQQTAQGKGETLEEGVRNILATLFDLESASAWKLRKQHSGTQYGFDLSFSAPDTLHRSLCFFECKNYSKQISLRTISEKLLQAEAHWSDAPVDHWILVSPHVDPANELDQIIESWNSQRRFPFAVQIWSPASGVHGLFQLNAAVYSALYGDSITISEARAREIVSDFRRRLEPPLRIPRVFAHYAGRARPVLLPADDPSWPDLLSTQIQRTALTETGAPTSPSLAATATQWCIDNRRRSSSLLLLADFGEGKSFFTFDLCQRLLGLYRDDPKGCPIPLRATLRDYRRLNSPKDFLELQLAYYGATLNDFGELRSRSDVVLILDGIDEMSVRQDGHAITENLQKLQELLLTIGETPVVLTSRPHFFESALHRTRFYDRLRRPLVYRLGQPSRAERLEYLHSFAAATGCSEKLRRVKTLYDPIGLSAKVLFLEMLKATLPELPDNEFSETVLYDTYIDSALRRKIDLLDDTNACTWIPGRGELN